MKGLPEASLALCIALAPTVARTHKRDSGAWQPKEERLLEQCHPKQRGFVEDPHRRVVALVGRGGGKTSGISARFARRMGGTRKAKCLYVATTRDQAIELMWEPLKNICKELNIPARFHETKLRCEFTDTGSTLRLVGADDKRQIEKYRGMPFHEVWIDEAASYPLKLLEHLIKRIIAPRLGDYNGMLGLVGTPGHVLAGEFYEASRPGSPRNRPYEDRDKPEYANWVSWSLHKWTLADGAPYVPALARLWEEAKIVKEDEGWSDDNPVWLREYCGIWAADDTDHVYRYRIHNEEGQLWNQWDPEIDTVTRLAKFPEGIGEPCFCYGMDFGHTDPTAFNVFAYSMSDPKKRLFHMWGFSKREMFLRQIAEVLIGEDPNDPDETDPTKHVKWPNHEKPGGLIGHTGWPHGSVADPKGLARGYIAELNKVYRIPVKLADQKSKFESIELTNGDFIDGRILILKGSELEEQLLGLQWAVDDLNQVKEDTRQRNDHCDTLIYARREALHLMSLDAPSEKPDNYSPYSNELPPSEGANNEFDGLLGGGFSDYWG